jgi:hypothetical protein
VAQGVGPEFKLQYCKKRKRKEKLIAKGLGGVAQVVECLTSKCESLNSNPVLPKKNVYLNVYLI